MPKKTLEFEFVKDSTGSAYKISNMDFGYSSDLVFSSNGTWAWGTDQMQISINVNYSSYEYISESGLFATIEYTPALTSISNVLR